MKKKEVNINEEFVTSFMAAELENSYDVPHKYSKDLAKEAYDMYADSSIYSEYDCIERVAKDYHKTTIFFIHHYI